MLSFRYLFIFGNILFILISLTNAVNLDISCTDVTACGGPGTICRSTCQCDTPWYTPCNTTQCNVKPLFVYEGQECRTDANCLSNAVCNNTVGNLCRCKAGFIPFNGLCGKNLNSSCASPSECWSGECRGLACQCPFGFIPSDDKGRCQRKLAKIYSNWTDANATGDFCYGTGSSGCIHPFAICQSDSQHPQNFCQCLPTHTANYEKQTCELIKFSGLSPSATSLSNEGCGKCEIKKALCVQVGNQTTCWCRAGYVKNNNECVLNRMKFIFPNVNDISQHKYASNCSINGNNGTIVINGLCTCASGYKFINTTSSCQPIQPEWVNENFEYGVCTRINSNGVSVQEAGLCPAPSNIKCEARVDKYVCSCGSDQYFDEQSASCYYFLERNLTNPVLNKCPPNSILNGAKCQCSPDGIFTMSANKKQCELTLSSETNMADCSSSNNKVCTDLYNGYARFCKQGECRCMSNSSYYENGKCVTFIDVNIDSGTNGTCPANAQNSSGLCTCNAGYGAINGNRTCVPKVNELNGPRLNSAFNVATGDCQALFPDQPVIASITNDNCTCQNDAFVENNRCIFYLDSSSVGSRYNSSNCPMYASLSSTSCTCIPGYIKNPSNTTCDRITNTVYKYNDTSGVNKTEINDAACRGLFGYAAEATTVGGYCRCVNENFAFLMNNTCYFLISTTQTTITANSSCAPGSEADESGTFCKCPAGDEPNDSKQKCQTKPIYSEQLQSINTSPPVPSCNASYTDQDCEALHGMGAVCSNNKCYCDRSQSFVQNNKCVLFTTYIFPGQHERHLYTCDSDDDCSTNANEDGIECGFNINDQNYKVCQCKADYTFNPSDGTCVKNQCDSVCNNIQECQGSQCVCKDGYYLSSSGQCALKSDSTLQLHDRCNMTLWNSIKSVSEGLYCSLACERTDCINTYHDDGSKCVKNSFNAYCVLTPSVCYQLRSGSECSVTDNKCVCSNGYYEDGDKCVLPVDAPCTTDEQCGTNKKCTDQLCECTDVKNRVDIQDAFGHVMQGCTGGKVNGVDQVRFSPVLFLLFILARIFFV